MNFIRTWDAKAPQTNPNSLLISSTVDSFLITTQYLDGLGRLVENVSKQVSPLRNDLVSAITYDNYGREQFKYLPFVANNTGSNNSISDGLFKLNPFQEDSTFSKAQYSGENYYYSQIIFENSPLNKVNQNFSPGNTWVGSSRGVQMQYLVNAISDSVRIWVAGTNSSDIPTSTLVYDTGQLYKTISIDEQNNQVVEYKDKEGHVILKKVQLASSPGSAHMGWLCTYYVYDVLGHLRFVLPPRAVELLLSAGNWTITTTIRDELCFYYGYDSKDRITIKKIPGAGEVWMVYDKRDRIVMNQDANLRGSSPSKWMITEYDSLNRPWRTGLLTDANNQSYHQNLADTSIAYPNTSSNYEILTQTGYDDYTNLPTGSPSSTLDQTNINSTNFITSSFGSYPLYPNQISQSNATKGIVTWAKTKVIGTTSTYLFSSNIYDDKGRLIQLKVTNYSGGTDEITSQFDFSGKVLKNHILHQKSGTNAHNFQLLTSNSYDHAGRLLIIGKRTSLDATLGSTDKIISANQYDELGHLKKKIFGSNLDSMVYEYNIRGWTLGANRAFAKDTTSFDNYFGFDLGYDNTSLTVNGSSQSYSNAQYNGNIGGMLWKTKGDQQTRKYDFNYDNVNRLTSGNFTQFNGGNFNLSAGIDFSVTGLSYDANGNILTMNQRGWRLNPGSFGNTIDSLRYTYLNGGLSNKLLNVIDLVNDTATKLGDFRSSRTYMTALSNNKTNSAIDYSYDNNGNLNLDNNKDINNITYNFLNLPSLIHVIGRGNIEYSYDAGGNKLSKKITDSTLNPVKITTTLYLFGNYVNDSLQFLPQEEGRIRYRIDSSKFVYDYFEKDHLGNVRMVLTEDKQTDAYPAATMESNMSSAEDAIYANLDATRSTLPSGYPTDNSYSNPNQYAAKVNTTNKIGPAIALKVMAGDQFNVRVSSWYSSGTNSYSNSSAVSELVTALANSFGSISGNHASNSQLSGSSNFTNQSTNFLNSESYTSTLPKAYLNWVLFDEQFNFVASSSGSDQVGNSGTQKIHQFSNLAITKNGYLYVYVSNQSQNQDVYFDNLQVTLNHGPLLEESHYYPFGLAMQGISSKAMNFGFPANKFKFNGIEQNYDFDLNTYDAFYRTNDPQIGRWWQLDPKGESFFALTPYNSMGNNPVKFNDPLGDIFDEESQKYVDALKQAIVARKKELSTQRTDLKGRIAEAKKAGDKDGMKSLNKQLKEVNSMRSELNSASTEIGVMERTDQLFVVKNFSGSGLDANTTGGTSYWQDKKAVVMAFTGTDFTSLIHEFKHGYDFLKGELSYKNLRSYDPNNLQQFNKALTEQIGSLYDYNDEVRAFRRDYSMDPNQKYGLFSGQGIDNITAKNPALINAYGEFNPSPTPKNTANSTVPKNEVIYKTHKN